MIMQKHADYKVIHFTKADRYICFAANYDQNVVIATSDHSTKALAVSELVTIASELNVELRNHTETSFSGQLGEDIIMHF